MSGHFVLLERLLDVIENDIAPKTAEQVLRGNKLFGAAVLSKVDLSLVIAETNNEVENPLWHGEIHTLKKLYERDRASLPAPRDCIFLATHEPCSLCLSAITWAGYDNFYFLFSHQDSRDAFAIPHDIRILREVFAVPPLNEGEDRPLYNRTNAYWTGNPIKALIGLEPEIARLHLEARAAALETLYAGLSECYQSHKGAAGIPLA